MLVVPFWWDRTLGSVAQLIHMARPDIPLPPRLLTGTIIAREMPQQRHYTLSLYAPQKLTVPFHSFDPLTGWYVGRVCEILTHSGG